MPRRILIATNTLPARANGVASILKQMARFLSARGDEVVMLTPPGPKSVIPGIEFVECPGFVSRIYTDEAVAFPPEDLPGLMRRFQPDLVHVVDPHVLSPLSLATIRCAQAGAFPLLLSCQTNYELAYRDLGVRGSMRLITHVTADILGRGDLVTFAGATTADTFGRYLACPYKTWMGGVDLETFHPARADRSWRHKLTGGEPDRLLFLSVGRLSPEKKIASLRVLNERFPEARLAIVGDGNQREELERVFRGTGTVFTGALAHDELGKVFASSDVFLFPSTMDANGLVGLEALASGCPVIGARVGGIPELVQDDVNGFLFEGDDSDSLIAATTKAVAAGRFKQLREACRRTALEHGWDRRMNELVDIYEATIALRQSPGSLKGYRMNQQPASVSVGSRLYGRLLETMYRMTPMQFVRAVEAVEGPIALKKRAALHASAVEAEAKAKPARSSAARFAYQRSPNNQST